MACISSSTLTDVLVCIIVDTDDSDILSYTAYVSMSAAQLQAHLVTSPFHPVPLIPILCVADEKNIMPLLRSALSQEQALGHRLPIIGVRFASSGPPICEVFLASEDDPSTEGEVLAIRRRS